jgi:hypothetical protein
MEYTGGKALVYREMSNGTIQETDKKFCTGVLTEVVSNIESGTGRLSLVRLPQQTIDVSPGCLPQQPFDDLQDIGFFKRNIRGDS